MIQGNDRPVRDRSTGGPGHSWECSEITIETAVLLDDEDDVLNQVNSADRLPRQAKSLRTAAGIVGYADRSRDGSRISRSEAHRDRAVGAGGQTGAAGVAYGVALAYGNAGDCERCSPGVGQGYVLSGARRIDNLLSEGQAGRRQA